MAYPDNNGSYFTTPDIGKSFVQTITTSLVALSSFRCSESMIINRTGEDLYIYDNDNFDDVNRLLILDGESFTLRGISNSATISAKTGANSGDVYYRAQYFSNSPSR